MNEREQILASIKKGILSSEEGLDLLEHLEKITLQRSNQQKQR